MSRLIIADEAMQKKLGTGGEPVMICAPDGTVLGYFTPTPPPQKLKLEPQISVEELERRRADPSPGYTTEEVIAYLKSLKKGQ
ncbi:MAG: hypothetical protein J0I06_13275 [Planctomycetes bacterium]|nr:hypothetical protein [Planctomycetota bacterium]